MGRLCASGGKPRPARIAAALVEHNNVVKDTRHSAVHQENVQLYAICVCCCGVSVFGISVWVGFGFYIPFI